MMNSIPSVDQDIASPAATNRSWLGWATEAKYVVCGLGLLLPVLLLEFMRRSDLLYNGTDGSLYLSHIQATLWELRPWSLTAMSHLQGMGAQRLPINPWVNLVYLVFAPGISLNAILASYAVAAATMCLGLYVLGRAVGITPIPSMIAGQVATLIMFPPLSNVVGIYGQFMLNPAVAFYIGLMALVLAIWIGLGLGSRRRNVMLMIALPLPLLYIVLCDPLWTVVLGMSMPIFFAGGCFVAARKNVWAWRIGGAVAALVVLVALGIPWYLQSLIRYTARVQFRTEIIGEVQDYNYASLLFQSTHARLDWVLFLGVILAISWSRPRQSVMALACLGNMAVMAILSAVFLFTEINWTFPLPVYLQQPAIPIYVLLAVAGWWRVSEWFATKLPPAWAAKKGLLLLAVPAVIAVMHFEQRWAPVRPTAEHTPSSLVALRSELNGADSSVFRGSFSTVFEIKNYGLIHDLHNQLWMARLPTLEEYSQLVTPQFFYFVTRGLGCPEQGPFGRNRVQVTVPRKDLLRLCGVRYVLSNSNCFGPEPSGVREVMQLDTSDFNCLGPAAAQDLPRITVFELDRPNVGNFSPTQVHVADTAPKIMALLIAPEFDVERDVVLTEPLEDTLVPADRAEMRYVGGGVQLRAQSPGRSLLVLPLQFSHALRVRPAGQSGIEKSVTLLRANLAQTAVLFEGDLDVSIDLNFGPFHTAGRRRDREDMNTLAVHEDGRYTLSQQVQRSLHPHARLKLFQPPGLATTPASGAH